MCLYGKLTVTSVDSYFVIIMRAIRKPEASTWIKRARDTLTTVFLGFALSIPFSLSGQTFQGQITDGSSLAPVTGAFIRLVSEDGGERGSSITGTSGFYSIDAPQPATYHL